MARGGMEDREQITRDRSRRKNIRWGMRRTEDYEAGGITVREAGIKRGSKKAREEQDENGKEQDTEKDKYGRKNMQRGENVHAE